MSQLEEQKTSGVYKWTPPPKPEPDPRTAKIAQTVLRLADVPFRIGARRSLRQFIKGPLDLSPVIHAAVADPRRLRNPVDLAIELFRPDYFRKVRFDAPAGDPGWFGPESASWYVLSHAPTILLGLLNTAIVDIMHQGIQAAVFDHSKLPGRDADGKVIPGTLSGPGLPVRAGHTGSFFIGVPLGPTEVAEALCNTVKGMHHKVKGVRPDGTPYEADDPEFFRWTYATVVYGFGQAHERYHPKPLKGSALDEYYREYTKIGEALGGTDLPATKAEVEDVLSNSPSAHGVVINQGNIGYVSMIPRGLRGGFFGWMIQDILPPPIQEVLNFRQPNPVLRAFYQLIVLTARIAFAIMGDMHEVTQAYARVGLTRQEGYRLAYRRLNALNTAR